jgi:PEP-CTERM motif
VTQAVAPTNRPHFWEINMTSFQIKSIASAVLALVAVSAQADTVSLPDYKFGSLAVEVNVAGVTNGTVNASAGAFETSVNSGASFLSYCLDLLQPAPLNGSASGYSAVAGASYSFANPNAAADLSKLFTVASSQVNNIPTSAAFQLAVWEIVYEAPTNAYSMGSGKAVFGVQDSREAPTLALANTWLNALSSTPATAPISILASAANQDLIYGGATAPIPEPSTYALMIAGLAGVGFVARRRAQKQA